MLEHNSLISFLAVSLIVFSVISSTAGEVSLPDPPFMTQERCDAAFLFTAQETGNPSQLESKPGKNQKRTHRPVDRVGMTPAPARHDFPGVVVTTSKLQEKLGYVARCCQSTESTCSEENQP